jgi:hypothetical protein
MMENDSALIAFHVFAHSSTSKTLMKAELLHLANEYETGWKL